MSVLLSSYPSIVAIHLNIRHTNKCVYIYWQSYPCSWSTYIAMFTIYHRWNKEWRYLKNLTLSIFTRSCDWKDRRSCMKMIYCNRNILEKTHTLCPRMADSSVVIMAWNILAAERNVSWQDLSCDIYISYIIARETMLNTLPHIDIHICDNYFNPWCCICRDENITDQIPGELLDNVSQYWQYLVISIVWFLEPLILSCLHLSMHTVHKAHRYTCICDVRVGLQSGPFLLADQCL